MKRKDLKAFAEEARRKRENELAEGKLQRCQLISEVERAPGDNDDKKSRTLSFKISTSDKDRMGDTVNPDGWKLKNYRKNPVVLFAHDHRSPPIAKAKKIKNEDSALKADAEFMSEDLYPFANMIFEMYAQGYMKSVSVGFKPIKWEWDDDEDSSLSINFLEQELLEFSAVPVPANPNALIDAKDAGIEVGLIKGWAEEVLDTWPVHEATGIALPRSTVEQLYDNVRSVDGGKRTYSTGTSRKDADPDSTDGNTPAGEGNTGGDDDEGGNGEENNPVTLHDIVAYNAEVELDFPTAITLMGHLLGAEGTPEDVTEEVEEEAYNVLSAVYEENEKTVPEWRFVASKVLRHMPDLFTLDAETGELKTVSLAGEEEAQAGGEEAEVENEGEGEGEGEGEKQTSSDDLLKMIPLSYAESLLANGDITQQEYDEWVAAASDSTLGADDSTTGKDDPPAGEGEAGATISEERLATIAQEAATEAVSQMKSTLDEKLSNLESKVKALEEQDPEEDIKEVVQLVGETVDRRLKELSGKVSE